jgi:hypothetical protein
VRIQELRRLRHEVHAALHDDVGFHPSRFDRELQRVAPDIGDAMEDLRRLVIMRQDDRVAGILQLVDRLDRGRHQRPLDRRDHLLDPLIEMRGRALDLGRPFQRRHRHRQRAAALGRADRAARRSGRMPASGLFEIFGTVDRGDWHGGPPLMF